jgi:hypothetical protein
LEHQDRTDSTGLLKVSEGGYLVYGLHFTHGFCNVLANEPDGGNLSRGNKTIRKTNHATEKGSQHTGNIQLLTFGTGGEGVESSALFQQVQGGENGSFEWSGWT